MINLQWSLLLESWSSSQLCEMWSLWSTAFSQWFFQFPFHLETDKEHIELQKRNTVQKGGTKINYTSLMKINYHKGRSTFCHISWNQLHILIATYVPFVLQALCFILYFLPIWSPTQSHRYFLIGPCWFLCVFYHPVFFYLSSFKAILQIFWFNCTFCHIFPSPSRLQFVFISADVARVPLHKAVIQTKVI